MLKDKCALVTGSVAGLGYAVAAGLAEAGCNVILNGLCMPEEGRSAADALTGASGAQVLFDGADLRDVGEIERMMGEAAARFGAVDIVVNNAVVRHFAPLEELTADQWDTSLAVNLTAAFHTVRLALPTMRARGWGRIVNMSSIYGSRGAENRIDYVTTKTGLIGMTRSVAIETARTGITCNAVCPGTVPSPAIVERIAGIAAERGIPPAQAEQVYLAPRHPTGRFVALEHVAALIVFLCSAGAKDITGAVLPIDGGWSAR